MFKPTIVADGEVVGTWRRTVRAREVAIVPAPFGPLSHRHRDGLEAAAHAYGMYLGRRATVVEEDPA